jgi:TolB-like protein/Tfp pilus assembly protein PilF
MFTDMVGYTALGQRNESLSLALVEEQRKIIRPVLARHNGREIKTMGDAFLVEFPNALDAVRCAYDIQRAMREFNISLPVEKRIHLRVGLHLGDVVEFQGDISGDAVNVASRIQPLAEDGGVCLTRQVYESTHQKLDVSLVSIGMKSLKNVSEPMEVYRMQMPWDTQVVDEAISLPRDRIAILPFRNMSPDPNDEYFAEGMTEEIISTVAGISGLNVISRTSIMGYKGTTKKVEEIGRELKAGSVLEGSFRKAGNRIRVTTQLIDVASDRHLWAQNYDRSLDDMFEVQSDVAKQVAEALRVRILSPELRRVERTGTANTAAYSLYLKGRYLWNKRMSDDVKKAAEYFEQAVREDPNFAPGYVGEADCILWLRGYYETDLQAKLDEAKGVLTRALELDPELAEAHATRGSLLMDEYRPREAEEEFKKAIELNPSYASAHQWYSWALMTMLRWNEAFEEGEKAMELDPLSQAVILNLVHVCFHRRDFGRALELARRAASLDAGNPNVHFFLMITYAEMNMHEEARREGAAWVEPIREAFPYAKLAADVMTAMLENDRETAKRLFPECVAHFREATLDAYLVAVGFFYLGDNDKGFEWLERSYSERESGIMEIKNEQALNNIRTDPRYLDLLRRIGLD